MDRAATAFKNAVSTARAQASKLNLLL